MRRPAENPTRIGSTETEEPMNDETERPETAPEVVRLMTEQELDRHRDQEIWRSRREAERLHLDATIPGGAFLAEDGVTYVNANGEPLDRDPEEIRAEIDAMRAARPPRQV
jgi:hypothetical protein